MVSFDSLGPGVVEEVIAYSYDPAIYQEASFLQVRGLAGSSSSSSSNAPQQILLTTGEDGTIHQQVIQQSTQVDISGSARVELEPTTQPTSPEAVDLSNPTPAENLAGDGGSETPKTAVSEGVDVLMSFTINNVEQSKPVPMDNTH